MVNLIDRFRSRFRLELCDGVVHPFEFHEVRHDSAETDS